MTVLEQKQDRCFLTGLKSGSEGNYAIFGAGLILRFIQLMHLSSTALSPVVTSGEDEMDLYSFPLVESLRHVQASSQPTAVRSGGGAGLGPWPGRPSGSSLQMCAGWKLHGGGRSAGPCAARAAPKAHLQGQGPPWATQASAAGKEGRKHLRREADRARVPRGQLVRQCGSGRDRQREKSK